MAKLAFLFPGQGSQYCGMGRDLAEKFPEARRVFEEADAALGTAISKTCFDGSEDDLKLTENTQPAILTVSVAAYRVLEAKGVATCPNTVDKSGPGCPIIPTSDEGSPAR